MSKMTELHQKTRWKLKDSREIDIHPKFKEATIFHLSKITELHQKIWWKLKDSREIDPDPKF